MLLINLISFLLSFHFLFLVFTFLFLTSYMLSSNILYYEMTIQNACACAGFINRSINICFPTRVSLKSCDEVISMALLSSIFLLIFFDLRMNLFVIDTNVHILELDINMYEKVLLQQGVHFFFKGTRCVFLLTYLILYAI